MEEEEEEEEEEKEKGQQTQNPVIKCRMCGDEKEPSSIPAFRVNGHGKRLTTRIGDARNVLNSSLHVLTNLKL
jgi:hypothetical protein